MADLTITAANVVAGANARKETGTAGATVTAGQCVYLDATTGRYLLSDADAAGKKDVRGIALHGASNGQPLTIIRGGDLTAGATLTVGARYYLSGTAGGIAAEADLASGDDVILIGIATSASVLAVSIVDTGLSI